MNPTDVLQRLTVNDLARLLGLHPFELVRALVATDALPADLRFELTEVDHARRVAGIETWWTEGLPPAKGPGELELAILRLLRERGLAGGERGRFDNLLRGLDEADRAAVEAAAERLVEAGWLATTAEPRGLMVSIAPERAEEVAAALDSGELPRPS